MGNSLETAARGVDRERIRDIRDSDDVSRPHHAESVPNDRSADWEGSA